MGNMLESDSSTNSDNEINQNKTRVRTAGDGMESDNMSALKGISNSSSLISDSSIPPVETGVKIPQIGTLTDSGQLEILTGIIPVAEIIKKSTSTGSFTSRGDQSLLLRSGVASKSPKQLPSRDLLIPIKPMKLEPTMSGSKTISSSSSYDKFAAAGVNKQKNPKFVPYEPYSCATRPIVGSEPKSHSRRPSDSSSVTSQLSTISAPANESSDDRNKSITLNSSIQSQSEKVIESTTTVQSNQKERTTPVNTNNNNHNPSTTLIKERLKIAEKEINELQSENARLKKLLVDSIVGATNQTTSLMNQNLVNGNAHGINESFDNLNDELEVWRSKFLSSCVLVEQLTKDNQTLGDTISSAADLIKDIKLSLSMTPEQYEAINSWFRQANPLISSNKSLRDENFNNDELSEN